MIRWETRLMYTDGGHDFVAPSKSRIDPDRLVGQEGKILSKVLRQDHAKGVYRCNGRVDRLIPLTWQVVGVDNFEGVFSLAVPPISVVALENDDRWCFRLRQDVFDDFQITLVGVGDLVGVS